VRSALDGVDGVESLAFEGKTATIVVDAESKAAVVAALEGAGYEAD
jgi:copper chaperone CopZ